MELLLKRNEVTGATGIFIRYDLFAKLELEPDEEARIRRAQPGKAFVWEGEHGKAKFRWRLCLIPGGILALIFAGLIGLLGTVLSVLTLPIAAIIWIPITKLLYNLVRPEITIEDLMAGRTIHCKSLDELYIKEHTIEEKAKDFCKGIEHMHSLGEQRKINLNPE